MAHINEAPARDRGRLGNESRLGGLQSRDTKIFPHIQALRRLTARLAFMADWRDDLAERIDRAMQMQERGALFPQEQDDLIDAVRAWRLTCARVLLDLDAKGLKDMRRVA